MPYTKPGREDLASNIFFDDGLTSQVSYQCSTKNTVRLAEGVLNHRYPGRYWHGTLYVLAAKPRTFTLLR